jgi:hypothetical protein
MIKYYRDMWQKRSHMLAPLTGLVSPLVKYKWGEEQQKAIDLLSTSGEKSNKRQLMRSSQKLVKRHY